MTDQSIILVGGPDSGKTNYLGRLWESLRSRTGLLAAPQAPVDIKYVEETLAHLLQGEFAPRSEKGMEGGHNFEIPVVRTGKAEGVSFHITVPDVSGELWKTAVETCELSDQWMTDLRAAAGALLFVRIGSDQNVEPLDWVNAAALLRIMPHGGAPPDKRPLPTQVSMCELLRFMEHSLGTDNVGLRPRVAILVTAWDRLDADRAALGPTAFLKSEYPLFAGRLSDVQKLDVRVFGVSVVGGDFIDPDFKQRFFEGDLKSHGYVVEEVAGQVTTKADLTVPVAWVVDGF